MKEKINPTIEQLKRWRNVVPTKKTLGLLASKGFTSKELNEIKTQYECYIILNNLAIK